LCGILWREHQLPGISPPRIALAPTPLAALTGARAGVSLRVLDATRLIGELGPLPLASLRWPQRVLERLGRAGVRTIGEALRLPRAGFAARFGQIHLDDLDRLTGRRADPRHPLRVRERFQARRELSYEIEHQAGLIAALAPLLQDLESFLRSRQCGITQLECRLHHRHATTRCMLQLSASETSALHLEELLSERLGQLALPEPVRACELLSGPLLPHALASESLWRPGEHGGGVAAQAPLFIERLRARLGMQAVHGIRLLADHRPEASWCVAEPRQRAPRQASHPGEPGRDPEQLPWPAFRRPPWLLRDPQPLREIHGRPQRHGPLRLLSEPERIESGWWDGAEAARDYYVAVDLHGARLWIFRERLAPHRWYLHGVFG
jgi:protein ImuB